MQTAWVHNLDPFAFHVGSFGIRWYGLSYLAGFVAGYWIIRWLVTRAASPLSAAQVSDFVFAVAMGTIIGGRLGYCIFYSPDLFTQFSSSPPFWGVLALNRGGMASHGGIIGVCAGCYWFGRSRKIPLLHLMDLTVFGGTVGIFFGRIANFINGELVGRPVESAVPWAVKFPQDIYLWPTQAPERLQSLAPLAERAGVSSEQWSGWLKVMPFDGSAYHHVEQVLGDIVFKIQAGSMELREAIAPLLVARHPSQLYEALLEGLLLFLVLFFIWRKPRKPGVIGSWFLTLYACVRIFGEQFRMPDAQIGFQALGLTRGQWLSIGMLVIGASILIAASRADAARLGGWGESKSP
jgi:phosphatidylglycerol:prolipoprotein diacylglycerol transferase